MKKKYIINNSFSDLSNLDIDSIRKLAVFRQGLNTRPNSISKRSILDLISQIGLIQVDSINVLQRNHYIVLFSRLGCFDTQIVDQLQYPLRKIVEQWIHVASIINHQDFKYLIPELLSRRKKPLSKRQLLNLGTDYRKKLRIILNKVKETGQISSDKFKENNPNQKQWWSKKPARVALDVLFRRGLIGISYRKNFKCFYEIQKDIISSNKYPKVIDYYKWATIKSINAMGVANIEQVSDYYRIDIQNIQKSIKILKKEKKIVEFYFPPWGEKLYTTKKCINILNKIENNEIRFDLTTFLSPFDNLIWNRKRTKKIFNFNYTSEMYTPAVKRKFGYFILPILHNGRLIGRLEPKYDRNSCTFIVKNIFFENGTQLSTFTIKSVSQAIIELTDFIGAQNISIIKSNPINILKKLKKFIKEDFPGKTL